MLNNSVLYSQVMGKTTVKTEQLRTELVRVLEETGYSVEEVVQKTGIGKTTIYENILKAKTDRTSVVVARKIAEGLGYQFRKEGDHFWFITTPPEAEKEADETISPEIKRMMANISNIDSPELRAALERLRAINPQNLIDFLRLLEFANQISTEKNRESKTGQEARKGRDKK